MEDTDQDMSEEVDSDNETWAGLIPGPDERTEQCRLGNKTLQLPELFLEKNHIFRSVLSMETWDNVLSEENRKHLEKYLPTFPVNDKQQKYETVKRLLTGENFKFGNPMADLQKKLKEGYLHPEIAKYRKQTRHFRYRDYKMSQQRHLSDLLKQLILSRQELIEQASALAPGEPLKFLYRPPEKKKTTVIEELVKKKTIRILKEVREECGIPDTSSDEDEETSSPVQRSRKQLFKSLGPIPSPEPTLPSVMATFASKPHMANGDHVLDPNGPNHSSTSEVQKPQSHNAAHLKRPRPISPVEVTEDSYKSMLKSHRKKKFLESDLPELDTSNITLQDILARCQANKRNSKNNTRENSTGNPAIMKKRLKMKTKGEKKSKPKGTESVAFEEEEPVMNPVIQSPMLDVESTLPPVEESMKESSAKIIQITATNFLCLLRDSFTQFPDKKASTAKLEERVKEWLETNDEISNPWLALQKNWIDQITSALKFLSGNDLGMSVENFVPFVEHKERPQYWRWISSGRDSDPELASLFRYWLQHKDDVNQESKDGAPGSPPPPKAKTNFIVRPTSSNEKALFREQERRRFAAPHKAFTFMMHGYDSVVGPVKGVYDKDSGTNKAREHNLLISERPPFVTILTLVRDAAARLPNGEGTRGDICELLKDSQFLAPGVTDAQINAVVSGALDRLHSEKDPCVKYDVNRKLWIYLHRNRTEDEFERIHQAQGAAAKAKKTLTRPKGGKAAKEAAAQPPTTTQQSAPSSLGLVKPTFTLSTLPSTPPMATSKTPPSVSSSSSPLPDPLNPLDPSSFLIKPPASAKLSKTVPSTTSNLNTPTVSQLRAAQVALARSSTPTGKIPTVKQLTSGQGVTTASTITNVTSSVLTVTSVGLSTTSSLAAQLLYSPGLPNSGTVAKLTLPVTMPLSTATTSLNMVTTINTSLSAPSQARGTPVSTISMLQNQKLLKQQQTASQSVLQQNAALVAAVGQTVAAGNSPSITGLGKQPAGIAKQTFSMTARQTAPSSVVTKNETTIASSKILPGGLKQASLILSPDAVGNLSSVSQSSLISQQGGKLVALNTGTGPGEGTVMAQIVHQSTPPPISTVKGSRSQSIKVQGANLVQPVISAKPIQLSGNSFAQAKGLVQLAGKGGHPLGLIRTPQGPISAINLIPQTLSTIAGSGAPGKAATVLAVGSPSSVLTTAVTLSQSSNSIIASGVAAATSLQVSQAPARSITTQAAAHAKLINQAQTGLVVTQLAQGGLALRPGTPGSATSKIIPSGQANLVPTQFILQHTPTHGGGNNTQVSAPQGVAAPLIVSNAGGKGAQNLQVMRTVLSQHGNLKPGQATILISQPPVAQGPTSTVAHTPSQVVQQVSTTAKTSGRGSPKGKGQPVYARIITPPPGLKLANVPVSGSPGSVNVLHRMGKLLATSGITAHQLPVVSLAMPSGGSLNHGNSGPKDDTVTMLVAGNDSPTSILPKKPGESGDS